ncbi:YdcF family protein [Candidatus Enterococcus ikei]|uniref:YdcF family protein n=1 Tax=Candidatus Enterococcus ikei TaxID=2815326 RepID=A0ABS3GZF0_9ENTE|nr:YdcF family protein [Enterococcus sp. DIV0869a]MBO0440632.1 YdcF family protein [Enterococcus sp. DIV0869a]
MGSYFSIIIGIIYLVGIFLIPKWRKKKEAQDWKFYELLWFSLCFIFYVIYLEVQLHTYYFLIPSSFLLLFLFSYFKEKRRLVNGLLFNLFLVVGMTYLASLLVRTYNPLLIFLAGITLVVVLLLILIGLYALLVFLYWNAIVVMRKEGHSLANLLTLLLAIGLTVFLIFNHYSTKILPEWASLLFGILPVSMLYFSIVFYNFLTISVIYQFNQPKYNQDFIIVLGSGLIDGKTVPPLLGKRIEKAIQFYKAQSQATLSPPKILMSGGKGDDEHIAEALAMKNYALEKGIPEEDILVETNSTNTLENMKFSKEIMETTFGGTDFHAIFTTNNFHLFRAGLFAKMANLKAEGIGAKTAFYFLPNAFLREFVAIVMMHKRRHLIMCGLITLMMIFLALIQYFVVSPH